MKNTLSVTGAIFLAMMGLSGCGDSGGACGNTAACGGDIVGTWTVTSSCVSATASMFDSSCPGATIGNVNIKVTGTATYNADKTYTSSATFSGSESVTQPASCLSVNGSMASCAQLTQSLAGNPGFKSATCTGTGGCTCNIVLNDDTTMETGTYTTTAAGLLTETPAGGAASQSDYCVKGKTMTDSPHAGSAMMGESLSGTITLTKS
ncbi:MAG TPA: hypothetical protein VNO55_30970 [Polyangia bacterium]|nr:hypothetical protein [Polyangia bacterium]